MRGEWIELEDCRLRLREDGIFECRHVPDVVQTLMRAKTLIAVMAELAGDGQRRPLMVVIGQMRGQERAARQYLMNDDGVWATLGAVALVVGGPVSRVIGSLFIGAIRPRGPLRLFDDEAAALAWLAMAGQ